LICINEANFLGVTDLRVFPSLSMPSFLFFPSHPTLTNILKSIFLLTGDCPCSGDASEIIVYHAAINARFDFQRQAMKPTPAKSRYLAAVDMAELSVLRLIGPGLCHSRNANVPNCYHSVTDFRRRLCPSVECPS
jgi:hypothetical protein